ncbi:iron-containing alcohol dehydrogenase family protein [Paenibacillus sp. S150]|uniref:iron-containing alcohol dehydrogenase family protein n=1 Tax=Paenibacillus sp. S150 TaxID=2749826 RepID=UPI001C56371F|nr:iron-containing alcohol dehydrogenase family protein [Paenibacillus sp. S150]MBW4084393.1 iron-containing alcohol dehydrogenase family protein [Paenibacillus sp. S150]
MFTVKAPKQYVSGPGVIRRSGELIASIGKHAAIIGGKKALAAAGPELFASLEQAGIGYSIHEFDGYVTARAIQETADAIERRPSEAPTLILGVGGGRVLDLTKAVGDKLALQVVTVPTVAATCAAWSALTVLYDEQGVFTRGLELPEAPVLVLADTDILAAAPRRYLASGISDTLVKWYEIAPLITIGQQQLHYRANLATARLALEILEMHAREAYRIAGQGIASPAFKETADAVIFLAGQAGSIVGDVVKANISHAIHNSLTRWEQTHGCLHGEKVAFGLVTQLFLEGKSEAEIRPLVELLHELEQPLTLEQLGLTGGAPGPFAREIARNVNIGRAVAELLPFPVAAAQIEQAILSADRIGRQESHIEGGS